MKRRLYLIILLAAIAFSGMAQTVGEAFYIYRNDGGFNAFFRDEIDSIAYSHYDADSLFYDEIVTQLVYTVDSVYKIPLAVIDSVGFVQPETVYKEDAKQLVGELFDYLIKADSLLLTFDSSLPSTLLPIVGDKLVATELTDKLPLGFTGTVRLVETTSEGYLVTCDSLALEDAVEQFYGVAELVTYRDGGRSRRYLPHRAVVSEQSMPVNVNLPRIHLPLDLTAVIQPKKVYDIEGSARADITIDPVLTGRVTYVVDSRFGFSHYNIHAVLDAETKTNVEIAGGVTKDDFLKLLVDKDVPMPWGYPLYVAFGPQFELSGELALGTTIYANFRHTSDITYYPLATAVAPGLSRLFNTESHSTEMTHFDVDWAYIAARAEAKLYVKGRLGLPFVTHEAGWVGAEFEIGAKCDAELNVDFEALSNAEKGTGLYETLKDSKIEVMPYWGAVGKLGVAKDRFEFKFLGRDDYSFWGTKWQWDFLPKFSDTKVTVSNGSNAEVTANITNDCIIPYTVGFSLFDENNNRVGEPHWQDNKFWTRNGFTLPMSETFTDLATDKKYKAYPTLKLFGFPVLASPSADLDMHFPVTLSDFKVTSSEYKDNGFTHNGVQYDYSFNVSVTAQLDGDATGIAEWGYVYLDPNGNEALIPLSQFGRSYTDTRWAYYRNEPHSTCTLYGYVKYAGSNEIVYGEPHDYPLDYQGETTCPDANHPHMIDLGLPSGTKWACCNLEASKPEEYGGHYAWGETSTKRVYNTSTYMYYQNGTMVNIGSDIAGTKYDAATAIWGNTWRMPTIGQFAELVNNCSTTWTSRDGVVGREFIGPSGGTIFLPAVGWYWDSSIHFTDNAGSCGKYWSSTAIESGPYEAWLLYFNSGGANCANDGYRRDGLSIRPVSISTGDAHNCSVILSDFKVTKSRYKEGGFENDAVKYDYRFDVSVTATLDVDDISYVREWGYVYEDPNGKKVEIPLSKHGTQYTDTRYAYFRNTAHSTARLYGYAYIVGNESPIYGEVHDFPLDHNMAVATTGDCSNVTTNSATVSCTYENVPEGAVCGVEYTWNEGSLKQTANSADGTQSITLSGLKSGTTYTYRAYIDDDGQMYYGEDKTFTTKYEIPDISGTWNCKEYQDGAQTGEVTLQLNANGTVTRSGISGSASGGNDPGRWSINADGKVYIYFEYVTYSGASEKSYSGTINSFVNPSQIEGISTYRYTGNMGGGSVKQYDFVMTR